MHVRMAPARAGRVGVALIAASLLSACWRPASTTNEISLGWTIEPSTPSASTNTLARITLNDREQQPVNGARLQLEAHMTHPGMAPVVRPLTARGGGVYEAHVQFSMAGDWVLVVTGELADGRRITRSLPIAGVRPAG